jgi:hypothetical protein
LGVAVSIINVYGRDWLCTCVWMFVWFCMHLPSCKLSQCIYSNFFRRFCVHFDIAPFVISLFGRYKPPSLWPMLQKP